MPETATDTATAADTATDTATDTTTDTIPLVDAPTPVDTTPKTTTDTTDAIDAGAAAAPDVPAEPPKPKPSVTRIDVIPRDATIEIDGKDVGTGSYMLRLQPGARAEVRLSSPGHRPETFTLRYPAPRKVSKRLWAAPEGSLKVRYLPANATLYLDGKAVPAAGGLNIVVVKAPAGPHSLRLVGPDGGEVTKEVNVLEGEQIGITLRIE